MPNDFTVTWSTNEPRGDAAVGVDGDVAAAESVFAAPALNSKVTETAGREAVRASPATSTTTQSTLTPNTAREVRIARVFNR